MTATASRNAWPIDVELAEKDLEELEGLGDFLLWDFVTRYETHMDQSCLEWSLVKQKESMSAYKQHGEQGASFDNIIVQAATGIPSLMIAGDIVAQRDDVMFGLLATDTERMNINNSYSQEGAALTRVLETMRMPTAEDPFRFMGIKWDDTKLTPSPFFRRRDLLYLECMGWTTLSNGEQVGYRIQQSVNLESSGSLASSSSSSTVHAKTSAPKCIRLPCRSKTSKTSRCVRATMSMGQIFQQKSDGRTLKVFMLGQYDPRGRIPESMRVSIAADHLLGVVPNALRCAQVQKLSWLAKHGWKHSTELYFGHDCECCGRRVAKTTIFGFPGGCWLCSKTVCSKCSTIVTEYTLEEKHSDKLPVSLDEPIGALGERQSWLLRELMPADKRRNRTFSGICIPDSSKQICSRRQLVCQPCFAAAEQEQAAAIVDAWRS